jgi:hypothetical protein
LNLDVACAHLAHNIRADLMWRRVACPEE